MKRALLIVAAVLVIGALSLTVMAARYQPVIRPNVSIGPVDVGGLTKEEAARRLRVWWEAERRIPISLSHPKLKSQLPPMTSTAAGLVMDDQASVNQIPTEEFWESFQRSVGLSPSDSRRFEIVWRLDEARIDRIAEFVDQQQPTKKQARAWLQGGRVVTQPEEAGIALDRSAILDAILAARTSGGSAEIPLVEGEKRVPDAALAQIVDVVSTFTTRFPVRQTDRNANIRLASSKLDGHVLMPGERMSFNETVGRRTIANGYRVAGVYVNGRHDTGVGGGICQVSTTLYNAVLLADLKVSRRQNHSLPVAYVPLGRDATVDFGSIDLVFENPTDGPIAIAREYQPGKLTFSILGRKTPGKSVKIEAVGHSSWSHPVKYVEDPSLAPGKTRVVDKGGAGRRVTTYRVVLQDGKVVSRTKLGQSVYRGGPRIVARNSQNPSAASLGRTASPEPQPPQAGSGPPAESQ